ncbi:MAG: hypothetical protein IKW77_06995 [Salinivirgaceae bacterium]|nr:hypothetical protein [Salinivirgaceae bacterium]
MATERYNNIGKGGIVKEGIFVRFPDLSPASENNYWANPMHSKLMIVGESSYFPDSVPSVFKDPEAWYKGGDVQHLIPLSDDPEKPKKYINLVNNWKTETEHVDRLLNSLKEVSKMDIKTIYTEAMYYNYFLRPATDIKGNQSFKKDCQSIDRDVAGTALCEILELDKPDIVIIASKYAYDEFQKYITKTKYVPKTRIEFVYHPTSHFQNWYKNVNSKQKFERLLKEYWIKGNK